MASFNLYTLDRNEIIRLLTTSPRYKELYEHMTKFCDGNQLTAQAFVVQKCEQIFRYDEYVHSASGALDKLESQRLNGLFKIKSNNETPQQSGGCYVATCVYGSYDCPEVWTLRRFRDDTLGSTWYGRAFIHTYYAVSPTLVKWFGETKWFKNMWRGTLDHMVQNLQEKGVADTPYKDKNW